MDLNDLTLWKQNLLMRHGLSEPDGRALYQYRVTYREFRMLELFLKLEAQKAGGKLRKVAQRGIFAALFVLYGAEWWRQKYDGSGFSWEPILSGLDADPDGWTQNERSACVERGLNGWKLQLRRHGGLRFLGTVAVQGGLPLRLLAEARGGIGQVLSRVLQLAKGSQIPQENLASWVESLQTMLPRSYRQSEIFVLLADVAWTTLWLKDKARLTPGVDAIALLDERVPDWRGSFPLPIEDKVAQGLIDQLVKQAVAIRPERQALCLPLERTLERDSPGVWHLRSSLTLPESIQSAELGKLFGESEDGLPRTAELELRADDASLETSLRRMISHKSYRVERSPWGFSGAEAWAEHVLRLSALDGRVWSVTAPRGEALDDELPWVFEVGELGCRFIRQGGGPIAATEALVALAPQWNASPLPGATAVDEGRLAFCDRRIVRVRGTILAERPGGLSCRIRIGHAGGLDENFEWHGNRSWLDFKQPAMAFRGVPTLYSVSAEGTRTKVDGKPGWGAAHEQCGITQPLGPVTARYPATGEVKHRTRMLILPPIATLKFEFNDVRSGAIRFVGWKAVHALPSNGDVRHSCRVDGADLILDVAVDDDARTPERLEVELRWANCPATARVAVPFPAKGVRAVGGSGKELPSSTTVAVQELMGIRLHVLSGSPGAACSLELTAKGGRLTRTHNLKCSPEALGLEVKLPDYRRDIQELLSSDDSPDALVQVAIRLNGQFSFSMNVARYAIKLVREAECVRLQVDGSANFAPEEIRALPVMAARLELPGDEAEPLPLAEGDSDAEGRWAFPPASRQDPGSWLIYPSPDSTIPFRPTLWSIKGDLGHVGDLGEAMGHSSEDERSKALDAVIYTLANDYMHPRWSQVEQLAGQLGHLPLVTLDIWRRFAHSPLAMASLAFRLGNFPHGFVLRFSDELPFVWESVPFSSWRFAMSSLLHQCKQQCGDEAGTTVALTWLQSRIKDLQSNHGALAYVLGIASAAVDPAVAQQVQGLRLGLGPGARKYMLEGDQSPLMTLRRTHAEDNWPFELSAFIAKARAEENMDEFLYTPELNFQEGVINLPLHLAIQVATCRTTFLLENPMLVHDLRTHRAFDPDWFDEAFNYTIAYCLSRGFMDR
jgi:hypothetical protein